MSKKMHPRNIYIKPPDFSDLAKNFPEFRKHVRVDLRGKVTLDFKDADAVRAYTRTLLQKDFNLDVNIPPNSLVPTVPLRLNYILWIEDLLSLTGKIENAFGVDIGTGASCVYPLIGARKNQWCMLGTDIDVNNIKCALENVSANGLDHLITVHLVKGDTILKEILDENPQQYDFCMCNPPFFGTIHELSSSFKARKFDRPKPRNAFVATPTEVVTKGGEVEFITQLINESVKYKNQVKIFTTMVGVKANLKPIMQIIEQSGVASHKRTEFFQGHTTRWGLAWTFEDINLDKLPEYELKKPSKSFNYTLNSFNGTLYTIEEKLNNIFDDLHISHRILRKTEHSIIYDIVAVSDTWSHNRRKRRQMKRLSTQIQKPLDVDFAMDCESYLKRELEESDDEMNAKRFKIVHEENKTVSKYLESTVYVRCENDCLSIDMVWVDGLCHYDALHQILQFVKNHLQV